MKMRLALVIVLVVILSVVFGFPNRAIVTVITIQTGAEATYTVPECI
jgi:hypothetical protein